MKALHKIAFILIVIGGLNWGLVALGYNVVDMLGTTLAKIIYLLVGLSAIYEAVTHKKNCANCAAKPMGGMQM
jgi:uncharacterized membrane protein YuzA (DUF378 family)